MTSRDPWFDNAKMTLVTLVVVGHSWTLLPATGLNQHLYDFLYTWHMPAFVLVTGYLSRTFTWSRARIWSLVRTLAIPYVLLEAALAAFRLWVGGEHLHHLWLDPHWPLWFLPALFVWRLATPLLRRSSIAIPVALGASLLGGLVSTSTLDVARILGFLPFYVIGLHATPARLEVLRSRDARILSVGVLAGVWVLSGHLRHWAGSGGWLYYNDTYSSLGTATSEGYVVRLLVLATGLVAAAAFLALVPRREGWFTRMGAVTLIVYLCHGFVVKGLLYAGYPDWIRGLGLAAPLLTAVIAVGLALVLASPRVSRVLGHLVDPFGYATREVERAVEIAAIEPELALTSPGP